jgi:hypothetical protein
MSTSTKPTKSEAQQDASEIAIQVLRKQGIYKAVPSVYAKLTKDNDEKEKNTEKDDVLKIIEDENNINAQFPTKGKAKYQSKYTSTVLGLYARKRDIKGIKEALSMGADVNAEDNIGMTCTDLLLIGVYNYKFVKRALKLFLKSKDGYLYVSKDVYKTYFLPYKKNTEEGDETIFEKVKPKEKAKDEKKDEEESKENPEE